MANKIAYLTIDDAPSEEFKHKVDFLLSKDIPAVFFCRGELIEERPKEIVYAIKKGFLIGNHSYNHPHFYMLDKEECFKQIERTDEIIEEIYKKSGVKRPIKIFRFPYGDKGGGGSFEKGWQKEKRAHIKAIQEDLRKLGYRQPKFDRIGYKWYKNAKLAEDADVVWTYDTHDWRLYHRLDRLEDILNRMDENAPEGCKGLNFPGSSEIIIMHDHAASMEYFKRIINRLLEKKIKFMLPKFK